MYVCAQSYGSDDVEGRFVVLPMRVLLKDLIDVSASSTDIHKEHAAGGPAVTPEETAPSEGDSEGGGGDGAFGALGSSSRLQLPFEREQEAATLLGESRAVTVGSISDDPGACFQVCDLPISPCIPPSKAFSRLNF